jgi:hypothetical protein
MANPVGRPPLGPRPEVLKLAKAIARMLAIEDHNAGTATKAAAHDDSCRDLQSVFVGSPERPLD